MHYNNALKDGFYSGITILIGSHNIHKQVDIMHIFQYGLYLKKSVTNLTMSNLN